MNHQLQKHQQQDDPSAYQYGRMRGMGQEIVLGGFEVYQPLLAISNNTGGAATGTTWIQQTAGRPTGVASKGSDKTMTDNMELTVAQEKNNLAGDVISKSTNSLHLQKFETSFV